MSNIYNQFIHREAEEDEEDEDFDPDESSNSENDDDQEEDNEVDEREKDYKRHLEEEVDDEENYVKSKYRDIKDDDEEEDIEDFYNQEYNAFMNRQQDDSEELEKKLMDIYQQTKSGDIQDEMFFNFKDFDIYELKLSNLAYYQPKKFDKEKYIPEKNIKFLDDKGRLIEKNIPYSSYIRWKYEKDNDITNTNSNINNNTDSNNNLNLNSSEKTINDFFNLEKTQEADKAVGNSYLIEMKDGTYKIKIGDNLFDVNLADTSNLAFSLQEKKDSAISVIAGNIKNKMIIKKSYQDMFKDRRKSSLSYEDLVKNENKTQTFGENNAKTKTVHSYFDKNKFSREEYTAKPGKVNSLKKIERLYKQSNPSAFNNNLNNMNLTNTSNVNKNKGDDRMLNKKRKKNYGIFDEDDFLDEDYYD